MRRAHRVILLAGLLPLTFMLGGCETSGVWDSANNVSDKFQDMLADFNPFGTAKKPLPGERRAVFPEGVPGVQQGVPPELMPGHQQAEAPPITPPPEQPAAPKASKAKPKKTARTKTQAPAQNNGQTNSSEPAEDSVWPPPPSR